jgi:hypothetical protein
MLGTIIVFMRMKRMLSCRRGERMSRLGSVWIRHARRVEPGVVSRRPITVRWRIPGGHGTEFRRSRNSDGQRWLASQLAYVTLGEGAAQTRSHSGSGISPHLRVRACIAGPAPTPPAATCGARPLHGGGSFSSPRYDHVVRNP